MAAGQSVSGQVVWGTWWSIWPRREKISSSSPKLHSVLLRDVPGLLMHRDAPSQLRVVVGREHERRRTFGLSVAMYSGDH